MGTVTVTLKKRHVGVGASVVVTADVALSSSYASGGDTLTLKSLGLDTCYAAQLSGAGPGGEVLRVVHGTSDNADLKVQGWVGSTGAELTGSQTGVTARVTAHGNYGGA